ncbi:MAG: DinB family protein [Anaerolineaceae bacterium]|nr:DinB family protein [Anaerolineaceae bacterium]
MEKKRKEWSKKQKDFRTILLSFSNNQKAIELFMAQHAFLHSSKVSTTVPYSYADAILSDMKEVQWRRIPISEEHSTAWCIWHLARIEDITMNLLIADSSQLFLESDWQDRLNIDRLDAGNAMSYEELHALSTHINIQELQKYRDEVGIRTREIVKKLTTERLKEKVDPVGIERIMDERALVPESRNIADYWSRRNIAGLLLMPPTRHCFVHLNEVLRIKQKKK